MTEDRVEGRKSYQGHLQELKTRFISKGSNSTEFAVFSLALDCQVAETQARRADDGETSDRIVRSYWLVYNAAKGKADIVMHAVPCLADSFSEATGLIRDTFSACREENPSKTFPEVEAMAQLEMWRGHIIHNIPDISLGTFSCPMIPAK
jgi:hypothetical protein